MRAIFYTLLLIAVPALMQTLTQTTFSTAVDYNDFIIEQQDNVGTAINTMMVNLDADSSHFGVHADGKALHLLPQKILKPGGFKIPNWDASVALFLLLFGFFQWILSGAENLHQGRFADEDLNSINGILESIVDRETTYDENLLQHGKNFAKRQRFELIEDAESDEDYWP